MVPQKRSCCSWSDTDPPQTIDSIVTLLQMTTESEYFSLMLHLLLLKTTLHFINLAFHHLEPLTISQHKIYSAKIQAHIFVQEANHFKPVDVVITKAFHTVKHNPPLDQLFTLALKNEFFRNPY